MSYVCKKRNAEGREYIYLVESYRAQGGKSKQRILKNYGALDVLRQGDPDIYQELRAAAKADELAKREREQVEITLNMIEPAVLAPQNYGWALLKQMYKQLGLEFYFRTQAPALSQSLQLAAYSWALQLSTTTDAVDCAPHFFDNGNTKSAFHISRTVMNKSQRSIQPQINKIFKAMEQFVYSNSSLTKFSQIAVQKHSASKRTANLFLVDTSRYLGHPFRGDTVQTAVLIDSNTKIPICTCPFYEMNSDSQVDWPLISQLQSEYGINKVIITQENSLASDEFVTTIYNSHNGWLLSNELTAASDPDILQFALGLNDWKFNNNQTFAQKAMLRQRSLANGHKVTEKVIITWSKELAELHLAQRSGNEYIAQNLSKYDAKQSTFKNLYVQNYVDNKTGQVKALHPFLGLHLRADKAQAQFDGLTAIVSSEVTKTDKELLQQCREIWELEDIYKRVRTKTATRPNFFADADHFESFSFICFVAMKMLRTLKYRLLRSHSRLKLSEAEIVAALNSAVASPIGQDYWIVFGNNNLQRIHKALGIDWRHNIVSVNELARYVRG